MDDLAASLLGLERQAWDAGQLRVAGVDEAGRGPLAGPVVAGAVVFDRAFLEQEEQGQLAGLTDSKRLSPAVREKFFAILTESPNVDTGVGLAESEEIDRINILQATHAAMRRAVRGLSHVPDIAIVDGLHAPRMGCEARAVVRGDSKSMSIAAASVIAKVTRDRLMCEFDELYPKYGFAAHKGYGTRGHTRALFDHGPCPIHRRSFGPVRDAADMERRRAGGGRQDELW